MTFVRRDPQTRKWRLEAADALLTRLEDDASGEARETFVASLLPEVGLDGVTPIGVRGMGLTAVQRMFADTIDLMLLDGVLTPEDYRRINTELGLGQLAAQSHPISPVTHLSPYEQPQLFNDQQFAA
jgi:hypothetical protein